MCSKDITAIPASHGVTSDRKEQAHKCLSNHVVHYPSLCTRDLHWGTSHSCTHKTLHVDKIYTNIASVVIGAALQFFLTVCHSEMPFISAHVHAEGDLIRVTLLHCASHMEQVTVTGGVVSTDNCCTRYMCTVWMFLEGPSTG